MAEILLISASGPYLDPWHPFPQTSERIADLLTHLGAVSIREDVDGTLASLTPVTDLVLANFGNAGPGTPSAAARRGLERYLAEGGSLMALHATATAFPDWEEWEHILGGRWVRGTTFHPPKAPGRVLIDSDHVIVEGVDGFSVDDEFYTEMRISADVTVLAHHELDGAGYPVAWLHRRGRGKVVYIALGHDLDAYASAGARKLLARSAMWLLDGAAIGGRGG